VGRNVALVDALVGVVLAIAQAPLWLYPPLLLVFTLAAIRYADRQLRRELEEQ
jgi:hypothetical protein